MSFVPTNEAKPISPSSPTTVNKKKKNKQNKLKNKAKNGETQETNKKEIIKVFPGSPEKTTKVNTVHPITENDSVKPENVDGYENAAEKFPILKDQKLIDKFLSVNISNNQKGRMRQQIRDDLKHHIIDEKNGIYNPQIIMQKIHSVMNKSEILSDSDLRKIRILHNMLSLATEKLHNHPVTKVTKKNRKRKLSTDSDGKSKKSDDADSSDPKKHNKEDKLETILEKGENSGKQKENSKEKKQIDGGKKEKKGKSVKRYVVFVGNLPFDIDKDTIMQHFAEVSKSIKDVRIPGGDKKGFAYLELKDEASYQMALAKHHTMLRNRRINVLYTTVGKDNYMPDVKSKTAKLVALQKEGKLLGSMTNRKRKARRMKQIQAQTPPQTNQ